MAKRHDGLGNLDVRLTPDGKVVFDGAITNPKVIAAIRQQMRRGLSAEQAFKAVLKAGLGVMDIEHPPDGHTIHSPGGGAE
jgi:hypothetical protein